MQKSSVIVYGTSVSAERFLFQNRSLIRVDFFLEGNVERRHSLNAFHGKPVYTPEEVEIEQLTKSIIVVCSGSNSYFKIRDRLKNIANARLNEFQHFIPMSIFHKKMVVMLGNCHTMVLKQYLKNSKLFMKEYAFYEIPLIYQCKYEEIEDAIRNCDIFIHQDIRVENGLDIRFADENTNSLIKKKCKSITIPNLYGCGKIYYPELQLVNPMEIDNWNPNTITFFPSIDTNIVHMKNSGLSKQEIIKKIREETFCSKESLLQNVEQVFHKYLEREKKWDVKIMDYIMKNYRKQRLFYDPLHPTNVVLIEIAKRILDELRIAKEDIFIRNEIYLSGVETPIYPYVAEGLQLQFDIPNVMRITGEYILGEQFKMSLEDYIEEYFYFYYEDE